MNINNIFYKNISNAKNNQIISSLSPTRRRKKIIKLFSKIFHPFDKVKREKIIAYALYKKKRINIIADNIDVNSIPIYIISYNRLSYVKQMIEWLEKYKLTNINIIDNASTYQPLLQYLKQLPYKVYFLDKNYGHRVFWESGMFDYVYKNTPYILTDSDIAPNDDLPEGFIKEFYRILCKYPLVSKVGFALKINDLPKNNMTDVVTKWEKKFWNFRLEDELEIYAADIDTTFALYRPGAITRKQYSFYTGVRIAGNFSAIHIPWYKSNENETDEDLFYKNSATKSASWLNPKIYK